MADAFDVEELLWLVDLFVGVGEVQEGRAGFVLDEGGVGIDKSDDALEIDRGLLFGVGVGVEGDFSG